MSFEMFRLKYKVIAWFPVSVAIMFKYFEIFLEAILQRIHTESEHSHLPEMLTGRVTRCYAIWFMKIVEHINNKGKINSFQIH